MKSYLALFLSSIIFIQIAKAQSVGLNNASTSLFMNYRIPETSLRLTSLNGSFEFNSDRNGGADLYHTEYSALNTYLTPAFYFLEESDNKLLSLNSSLTGSYNYSRREQQYPPDSSHAKSYDLAVYIQGTYNNYFNRSDYFSSVSSLIHIVINDEKRANPDYYRSWKVQNYNFFSGFGWGKLRDVTSVVSSIRLQERLKQLNLISSDLTDKTIEDLAEQFSKSDLYGTVHERPSKYIWGDIEKTLNNNGIILHGLNMYGSAYLYETLTELRFRRNEGFIAGFNAQLNYSNNYFSDGVPPNYELLYLLGNLYLNFSHQLNLNSQAYGSISISGGPSVTKHSYETQLYTINIDMGYDYEVTDRLVVSANNTLSVNFTNYGGENSDPSQHRALGNKLFLSASYFIEDNFSLNTNFSWFYDDFRYSNSPFTDHSYNNIKIGFSYYFNKGFLYK